MTTIFDFVNDEAGRKAFLAQDAEQRRQAVLDAVSPERIAADAAAEQARRNAAQAAQEAQHEAALRDKIRWSYIAANGSEAGFSEAYPALRAQHVQAQTLAGIDQAGDVVDKFITRMNGGA